jgi:hypothetical protein
MSARIAVLIAATVAVIGTLSGCASSSAPPAAGGLTSAAPAPAPSATPSPTPAPVVTVTVTAAPSESPATPPAGTFTDGTTYDVWVPKVHADGTIVIRMGEHLVGKDAADYLNSHGSPVGPDGVPDDYTNVDLGKQYTVSLSDSATITINDGSGPKKQTVAQFRAWLPKNLSQPIPANEMDKYTGAPHYFATLLAVTFSADAIVSINQIFMP